MLSLFILAGALAAAGGVSFYCLAKSSEKEDRERKEYEDYLERRNVFHPVELVSSNYNGRKKYKKELGYIETDFYGSVRRAKEKVRELARKLGRNMVINVGIDSDTDWEPGPKGGTHYYTVWRASGIAVKK